MTPKETYDPTRDVVEPHPFDGGIQYWFYCPGCKGGHAFTVKEDGTGWKFSGTLEKPTFTPSLLCNQNDPESRCHSFVRDGWIEYLADCFHELKGQTVPLTPDEKAVAERKPGKSKLVYDKTKRTIVAVAEGPQSPRALNALEELMKQPTEPPQPEFDREACEQAIQSANLLLNEDDEDWDARDPLETYDAASSLRSAIKSALAHIDRLEESNAEYKALFDLQWSRLQEATKLWRESTGQHDTSPDLGNLLTWLMGQLAAKDAEIERMNREKEESIENSVSRFMQADALRLIAQQDNEKLRSENEALRKDAERYRIVRTAIGRRQIQEVLLKKTPGVVQYLNDLTESRLDHAIDAAIAAREGT